MHLLTVFSFMFIMDAACSVVVENGFLIFSFRALLSTLPIVSDVTVPFISILLHNDDKKL